MAHAVTILNRPGLMDNPSLGSLCLGFLDVRDLMKVSRAFRDAVKKNMIQVAARAIREGGPLAERFYVACVLPDGTRLDPTKPEQISACFCAVFRHQRLSLSTGPDQLALRPKPSFALPELQAEEAFILVSRVARENDIREFRHQLNPQFNQNLNTPQEIRTWIAEHPQEMQRMTTFTIHCQAIHPEIGKFTALKELNVFDVSALPLELGHLTQLQYLQLGNCSFRALPEEVLLRLPALENLGVDSPTHPIRVLPDALYRKLSYTWGWILAQEFDGIFDEKVDFHGNRIFRLDRDQFHQIPRALWMQEKMRIPNLPIMSFPAVNRITEQVEESGILIGLVTPLVFFLLLPFILLHILVNLPIALLNIITLKVVEPIVTWICDLKGYSRLVNVQ